MDVGYLMSESETRTKPGADALRTRVVVTRHRNQVDRGVGEIIEGWRYEVFVTNLPDGAWPAAEVVTCYYGRVGQENRFGQEDRELELDRIFSYSLPGQWLVNLFGLFYWNLQTVEGWRQLRPDQQAPQIPPKTPRQPQILDKENADAVSSELVHELGKNDWDAALSHAPGWKWEPELGLLCPAGHTTPLKRLFSRKERWHAIFRAPRSQCGSCPVRSACTKSLRADFRKELHVQVASTLVPTIKALRKRRLPSVGFSSANIESTPCSVPWEPPQPKTAGVYQIAGPILVPTVLRRSFRQSCRLLEYHIRVDAPPHRRCPPHLALTPERRQRRRKTWEERNSWNALDTRATVEIEIHSPRRLNSLPRAA